MRATRRQSLRAFGGGPQLRLIGGGCTGSKPNNDKGLPPTPVAQDVPISKPSFPEPAPMWLMPFKIFKQQGRIAKSLKPWREEAKAKG